MPFFVNVPFAPGIPPVNRVVGALFDLPEFLTEDLVPEFGQAPFLTWGLFQDGTSVITADSVQAFEYRQDWSVSNYPVEQGAFESYNKVQTPFNARIRFAMGGSEADRNALLESIQFAANGVELFDLVTPEIIYSNVNVTHYDYRRTAYNGMGLLMVDVWVEEIRNTGITAFTQTKSPSGADDIDDGTLQPNSLTSDQENVIDDTFMDGGG